MEVSGSLYGSWKVVRALSKDRDTQTHRQIHRLISCIELRYAQLINYQYCYKFAGWYEVWWIFKMFLSGGGATPDWHLYCEAIFYYGPILCGYLPFYTVFCSKKHLESVNVSAEPFIIIEQPDAVWGGGITFVFQSLLPVFQRLRKSMKN